MILLQGSPTLPSDTPGWVIIALAVLVPLVPTIILLMRRWSIDHSRQVEVQLSNLQAVRNETLRIEALPPVPTSLKILYLGMRDFDLSTMARLFEVTGIDNRLIVKDSPQSAYDYLAEHLNTVLFVIVFVEVIERGYQFLKLVKENENTRNIPVFFLDGFDDTIKIKLFEDGIAGYLVHPMDMAALLILLNRLGYSATLTKDV